MTVLVTWFNGGTGDGNRGDGICYHRWLRQRQRQLLLQALVGEDAGAAVVAAEEKVGAVV